MPHVVVKGDLDLARIAGALRPVMERRDDGQILKTQGVYLSTAGDAVLVKALAIESDGKQEFLAAIQSRDDGVVVRLDPLIDPKKTDGVKRILALLARQVKDTADGAAFGETNLSEFLD